MKNSSDPEDRSNMNNPIRWESQSKLVERIAKITTWVLPQDEGVALRFINQDQESPELYSNLGFGDVEKILKRLKPVPEGSRLGSKIGTNLRAKILEPLIYKKLDSSKGLERPVLISILIDGEPTEEGKDTLKDNIVECGQKLKRYNSKYPPESAYCNCTCASQLLTVATSQV